MTVFKKALTLLIGNTDDVSYLRLPKNRTSRRQFSERELIQKESNIGRELFGPIPKGHRREFFCLDESTCVWYEESKDDNGKTIATTTRYEIQGERILKAQQGAKYSYLEGAELRNLLLAIGMYYERVMREVYRHDPKSGHPLAN